MKTTIFLVFEDMGYDGHYVSSNSTRAFHTLKDAEAYVQELDRAEDAKAVEFAKRRHEENKTGKNNLSITYGRFSGLDYDQLLEQYNSSLRDEYLIEEITLG